MNKKSKFLFKHNMNQIEVNNKRSLPKQSSNIENKKEWVSGKYVPLFKCTNKTQVFSIVPTTVEYIRFEYPRAYLFPVVCINF